MTKLTVVVVSLEGFEKLNRCLNALYTQHQVEGLEIIVPHDDRLRNVGVLTSDFPDVLFAAQPGRHTYAALRSYGVRISRGEIVAITEDHCIPRVNWAMEIIKAHEADHEAIGGAVEKKFPDSRLNWAMYLIDYLRYSNVSEGPTQNLTDCNVSYKRTALARISEVWKKEFHEPEVNRALHARGMSLWISPNIVLDQQRTIDFGEAIHDRYRFGRLFGARRASQVNIAQRALYLIIAPLLPAHLTIRTMRHAHAKPGYSVPFWRSFWLVVLLNSVWAWGEFIGSITRTAEDSLFYPSDT